MINQIIVGHMLGDGHIAKVQGGNSYFTIHRKAEHHEYNLWTKKVLLKNGIVVSENYPKIGQSYGYSFPSSYLRTARDEFWNKQRSLWYRDERKILPKKYIKKNFDNLSFLIWFLDDGDLRGRISTDGFSIGDIMFLKKLIQQKYGIKFNIRNQYNRPQHNILVCPKNQNDKLLTIFRLSSISVPCVSYKLDLK